MSVLSRDDGVRVGKTAYGDPVLAHASLEAATMIRDSIRVAPALRLNNIMSQVRARGPGLERVARTKVDGMVRRGVSHDQAVFDAVRMTLADKAIGEGIAYIRQAADSPYYAAAGLGSARDVGCAITGGITAVGGFIASIFGGAGGGGAVGAGGGALSEAIGCNDAARAAAARNAQQEAQAAADMLEAARVQAEAARVQAASAALTAKAAVNVQWQKGKLYTNLALIGGGALLVLGVGYFATKD